MAKAGLGYFPLDVTWTQKLNWWSVNMEKIKLKPCPFCGGEAVLTKTRNHYTINPLTIKERWKVLCKNECCETKQFEDLIYHDDSGEVVIEHNGAHEAAEAWNTRFQKEESVCQTE